MRFHVNNCLAINKSILIKLKDQKLPLVSILNHTADVMLYYFNLKWNNKQLRINSHFKDALNSVKHSAHALNLACVNWSHKRTDR